jgi:hypothetical protein
MYTQRNIRVFRHNLAHGLCEWSQWRHSCLGQWYLHGSPAHANICMMTSSRRIPPSQVTMVTKINVCSHSVKWSLTLMDNNENLNGSVFRKSSQYQNFTEIWQPVLELFQAHGKRHNATFVGSPRGCERARNHVQVHEKRTVLAKRPLWFCSTTKLFF